MLQRNGPLHLFYHLKLKTSPSAAFATGMCKLQDYLSLLLCPPLFSYPLLPQLKCPKGSISELGLVNSCFSMVSTILDMSITPNSLSLGLLLFWTSFQKFMDMFKQKLINSSPEICQHCLIEYHQFIL